MSDDMLDDDASAYLDGLLADPHRNPSAVVARAAEFSAMRDRLRDLSEPIPMGVRDRALAAAMAEFGAPPVATVASLDQHRARKRWLAGGAGLTAAAAAAGFAVVSFTGGSTVNVAIPSASQTTAESASANVAGATEKLETARAKDAAAAPATQDAPAGTVRFDQTGTPSAAPVDDPAASFAGSNTGAPNTTTAPSPPVVAALAPPNLGEQTSLSLASAIGPLAAGPPTGSVACNSPVLAFATWEGTPAVVVGPFLSSTAPSGRGVQVLKPEDCTVLATVDVA
jgi:hypothetical protein